MRLFRPLALPAQFLLRRAARISHVLDWERQVSYVRSIFRFARDSVTYDPRRNPAVWIGFVLAVPIALAACLLPMPAWLAALAFGALLASTVIVAAIGRLAGFYETELASTISVASRAGVVYREESARLTGDLFAERLARKGTDYAAQILQAEVREARTFHDGLVPDDIDAPGVQVRLRALPSTFLGGDYLRASLIKPGCLFLCAGDVSGHGIAAALIVSRIHGLVRGLIHDDLPPERILDEVNRQLSRLLRDTYHFMTFAVYRVDLEAQTIHYATAGHPAGVLLRADGGSEELSTPNGLLGMGDSVLNETRRSGAVAFSSGDSLVLFTDGLFEISASESGLLLGHETLRSRLAALTHHSPDGILDDILRQARSYQGKDCFADDVSILVARFTGDAQIKSGGEHSTVPTLTRELAAPAP